MAGLFKAPTSNFFSTSLNGAINDSVDTFTLNSTTGLQSPGYLIIDREDGSGTATPDSREVVKYTGISSNDLTGVTRGADSSTARSHSDGALVESTFTIGMHNDQRDAINAEHAVAGTHTIVSNVTVTAMNVAAMNVANASITTLNAVTYAGNKGHFYWSKSSMATVLNATVGDTHFSLQRATKNLTLNSFYASLTSSPSTVPTELDVSWSSGPTGDFTSIFSPRPFIDVGEYTTDSGATAGTLSLTSLASGNVLRFEIRMPGTETSGMMAQLTATERA